MELQIVWNDAGIDVMELPYHEVNYSSANQTLAPECSFRYWSESRSPAAGEEPRCAGEDGYWQDVGKGGNRNAGWQEGSNRNSAWQGEGKGSHADSAWHEEVTGNRSGLWPEVKGNNTKSSDFQVEAKGNNAKSSVWQEEVKGSNTKNSAWQEEVKGSYRSSAWLEEQKGSDKVAGNGSCSDGKAGTMATVHRKRKFWEQQEKESGELGEERKEQRDAVKKQNPGSPGDRMSTSWDLAENLAADLDGSLSGLGVDLSTASYNMSEALLALPSLTVLKQEAPSPNAHDNGLGGVREADSNTPSFKNALQRAASQHGGSNTSLHRASHDGSATSLHQLLQGGYSHVTSTGLAAHQAAQHADHAPDVQAYQQRGTKTAPASSTTTLQDLGIDCRFQYVLAAATSIATKMNEETLTYLNQGQSYEIKLKKLGELSAYRGKILKSVIRICFHERRLQYMEAEQMTAWRASRPGDRIVEVDIPLSYGIYDVIQDQWMLNTVEFLWDPTKEVGVYIKVNCISTEFTPKKHGGEKGVPFRIQVETYLQGEGTVARLHAGACQIKVFKLKGGDRKHKQDREKILKRPASEHDKFQPSYDCTVLNDIPSELMYPSQMNPAVSSSQPVYSPPDNRQSGKCLPAAAPSNSATLPVSVTVPLAKDERSAPPQLPSPDPAACPLPSDQHSLTSQDQQVGGHELMSDATAQQTAQWLQTNRFSTYLRLFASFSGADILRLSRDDLIQICGLPDGIRLFNALHARSAVPQLTLYMCAEHAGSVFHALYLVSASSHELTNRLAQLLGLSVRDVFMQGPANIHFHVTDDVMRYVKDEAMFIIEVLQDPSGEMYNLLLKPTGNQ